MYVQYFQRYNTVRYFSTVASEDTIEEKLTIMCIIIYKSLYIQDVHIYIYI